VIIPDLFGWQLPDVGLLADSISQGTGATVYVPDFMFGDSLSTEYLHLVHDPKGLPFIEKACAPHLARSQQRSLWLTMKQQEALRAESAGVWAVDV
jgi:hypothetical protein